jgi:hypothetical protein
VEISAVYVIPSILHTRSITFHPPPFRILFHYGRQVVTLLLRVHPLEAGCCATVADAILRISSPQHSIMNSPANPELCCRLLYRKTERSAGTSTLGQRDEPFADTHIYSYSSSELTMASSIFGVPELMEAILLELPMKDVLLSRRVNKQFKATIEGSVELQQALFFVPSCQRSTQDTKSTTATDHYLSEPLVRPSTHARLASYDDRHNEAN